LFLDPHTYTAFDQQISVHIARVGVFFLLLVALYIWCVRAKLEEEVAIDRGD
jgi:hypothetical protein